MILTEFNMDAKELIQATLDQSHPSFGDVFTLVLAKKRTFVFDSDKTTGIIIRLEKGIPGQDYIQKPLVLNRSIK